VPAVTEAGVSAVPVMVKSGAGFTVKLTVLLWMVDPEVPVTVTLEVPTGVLAEVLRLDADVAGVIAGTTELGSKAQLTPAGKVMAEQVSATELLNPLTAANETV
jgi:hypothetical protein